MILRGDNLRRHDAANLLQIANRVALVAIHRTMRDDRNRPLIVVDAKVQPEKLQSVVQTLIPYLNQSLRSYFNQQPAYVLREDASTGEALAKKYAKGIEVKPGEIIIPFTN